MSETQTIALSSSAITAFQHCPYQFFELRKHRDVEKVTDYLELGNIVHATLFAYHDPDNTLSLKDIFKKEWEGGSVANLEIFKTGLEMLDKYETNFAEEAKERNTILREYRFSLELMPGYIIRGIFDRVDQLNDDGDYEIIEYKTSATPKTQDEVDTDLQIAIYDYAFHRLVEEGAFGDIPKPRNVTLSVLFLRHYKLSTSHTDAEREQLHEFLVTTAKQINECTNPKKKLNPFCSWCVLKDGCEVYTLSADEELFAQSIDFMTEEELMEEYKRVNYLLTVGDDRKKRLINILRTKLEMLGIDSLTAGEYKCYLQPRNYKNYDVSKLREVLEPLGLFNEVCRINNKNLDRIAHEYGLEEVVLDASVQGNTTYALRVKKY